MNNLQMRILVFVIGIPLLLFLSFVQRGLNHLGLSVLAMAAAALGGVEMRSLLSQRLDSLHLSPASAGLLALSLPALTYLEGLGLVPAGVGMLGFPVLVLLVFARQAFWRDATRARFAITNLASAVLILLYPGWFVSWALRLAALEHSVAGLALLVGVTFLNDSAAYVAGRLLGQNRGMVAVSPGKSIAGFAAGILVSTAWPIVVRPLVPLLSGVHPALLAVIGFGLGAASIVGDLVESALKRAGEIKDSGTLIPGRGGVLDSIDSPLFVAPILYYVVLALERGSIG